MECSARVASTEQRRCYNPHFPPRHSANPAHGAAFPHLHPPLLQLSAFSELQAKQPPPPLPQTWTVFPGSQLLFLQQPWHALALQTHWPFTQA